MEDYIRRQDENVSRNLALKCIQGKLRLINLSMEDLLLPIPNFQLINRLIQDQMGETDKNTIQEKRLMGEIMMAKLNDGQRAVFDQIMASVNDVDNVHPDYIFWVILEERERAI